MTYGKLILALLMASACASPGDTNGKVCTYDTDCLSGQVCVKANGVPEGLCQSKPPDTSDSANSDATTEANETSETEDATSSPDSPTTSSMGEGSTGEGSTGGGSELIVLCHRAAGASDSDWPGNGGEAFGKNRFLVDFTINAGKIEVDENNDVWCRKFDPDFADGIYVDNVDAPIHPAYPGLKVCDADESNRAAIRCADPASLEDGEQYYFTFEVTHEDPSLLADMSPLMLTGVVYSGEVAVLGD